MFVRQKKNKSGSISVQVIDKQKGRYFIIQTIGCSKDLDEIEKLVIEAKEIIANPKNQPKLFSLKSPGDLLIEHFLEQITNSDIHTIGPELILGTLFDKIGFNVIPDSLFRHTTIARLCYPTSKLKTVDYLYRYQGIKINVDRVYRFLDKLNSTYKEKVERIAYEHTKKILKGRIIVVFYDMTTLYFEAEDEDDLRKVGFSKDGKFQNPQIMLGLLVGESGYPIGYDIFTGNTFEGHTLLPILDKIQKKYNFNKPVVVADAALLSKDNLSNLAQAKYKFIIGARIKNESDKVKKEILTQAFGIKNNDSFVIKRKDKTRLIVMYSDKRAKKDAYNRERGIRKLQQKVKSGKLTKEHINNRGYNKFLTLTGDVTIKIDEDKIGEDRQWDGLKGYITNTQLSVETIVANYGQLWQIEKAFRISKTDLRVRPIYHYREKRIKAHICVAFVAYTIYKELERLLNKHKAEISPKRAIELTHTMYELSYMLPEKTRSIRILLKMDKEQQILYNVINKLN